MRVARALEELTLLDDLSSQSAFLFVLFLLPLFGLLLQTSFFLFGLHQIQYD